MTDLWWMQDWIRYAGSAKMELEKCRFAAGLAFSSETAFWRFLHGKRTDIQKNEGKRQIRKRTCIKERYSK